MINVKKISSRIEEIYREFYYDKALDRYCFLEGYARSFVSQLDLPDGCSFYVCDYKLRALVHSYFLDVIRFKEYHFEPTNGDSKDTADRDEAVHKNKMISLSKVAAFTVKWIVKYSPITIIPPQNRQISDEHIRVITSANAMFALQCAIKTLGLKVTDINPTIFANALYHLRFRAVDDRSFFLFFDALHHGSRGAGNIADYIKFPASTALSTASPDAADAAGGRLRTIKVFVASPGDCSDLRGIAKKVIDELNLAFAPGMEPGVARFLPYFWENDKKPGISTRIQDDIFAEASTKFGSESCDILVMTMWHKYGEGTLEEYEYYVDQMGVKDVFFCRYAKQIAPHEVDGNSLDRLNTWLEQKQDNWTPLGNTRNSITDEKQYEDALRMSLQIYHEYDRKPS